ncbi:MAG TPA: NAD-dependent epimerase/dehydratase family protein [Solirubrobacteraceae bacterium]|jgi:UDP-glucose 4-epimerase|nr:NAD-dependent epimerase/dehydratase family protein [Solirubrobacteraceae bacterium]
MTECLVVGGGFLGGHVAVGLVAAGHSVTLYSRSFSDWLGAPEPAGGERIRRVQGVLPPGDGLAELVDAAEIVFFLAGSSTPTMAGTDPGGSIMSSVVPATALFDLMRSTTTRRVVLASSGGAVYGVVDRLPTPEDHPTEPISIHGHNSLTVERYAMFYARHHGFEPVILRYANPYGPGQLARRGQGVIATWCDALARGRPISVYGDPATRRDLIYVDDAAAATVAAGFAADAPGTYNVGSGCSFSLDELAGRLQRISGRQAPIERLPHRGVDVPATQLDCSLLRSQTGWEPVTGLDDGLRASWEWARGRCEAGVSEGSQ